MKNDFYIYNPSQANFFLQQGLEPVKIGVGNKRAIYVKYLRNEESEGIFAKWCELCLKHKGAKSSTNLL